jgi:hypothetical protein
VDPEPKCKHKTMKILEVNIGKNQDGLGLAMTF